MARFGVGVSGSPIFSSSPKIIAQTYWHGPFRRFGQQLALLIILTGIGLAQSDPTAGVQPFSTQAPGGIYESIDLATNNIYVEIPVRSKGGKIPFSYSLAMQPNAWILGALPHESWQVTSWLNGTTPYPIGFNHVTTTTRQLTCNGTSYNAQFYSGYYVIDSTGARHAVPISDGIYVNLPAGCYVQSFTAMTADGSGYTLIANAQGGSAIYDKSGNEYVSYTSTLVKDPDGTTITSNSITGTTTIADSLNEAVVAVTLAAAAGDPNKYEYADAAGNAQTFQTNYSAATLQTAFGCTGIPDIAPAQTYLPTSVTLPIGTVTFTYETTPGDTHTPHYVTGRLASITYPAGGSVAYAYSGGNNGVNCTSGHVPTLTKTINDGKGNLSKWVYINSNTAPGNTVTVIDPASNYTVYTFAGEYQTQAQYYEGPAAGTPLKTVVTCYNKVYSSLSACVATSAVATPTQTDVYTYLGSGSPSLVETKYDGYGNVTAVSKYDFGATFPPSSGAPPVSTTTVAYNYPATMGGAYPCGTLAIAYMYDRPCSITTTDFSGAIASQVSYTYNSHGHPITTSNWVSTASSLGSSAVYDSATGVLTSATDVNGATYTYAYNGTGGCNNLLPTSVTVTGAGLPVGGLTTSKQWDCNGAVITLAKDANSQPTSISYNVNGVGDPFYRPLSVGDSLTPPNTTNLSYSVTTAESAMNFNGAVSASDQLSTVDGIGRPIFAQRRQGQGPSTTTFDTTQTSYGWTTTTSTVAGGAFTQTSMPYTSAAGQSAPTGTAVTTTQYDALGRPITVTDGGGGTTTYTYIKNDVLQAVGPTQTFQRQLEYDGLGRLTSVCEITSASGSGSGPCNQKNPQTGLLTSYTYDALNNLLTVTQNAQTGAIGGTQSRTYTYDSLSRLTSESNPESGTNTYVYDSATNFYGCSSSSAGDLVAKADANGNGVCYLYDPLHRLAAAGNSNQSASNPCKRFLYDNTLEFSVLSRKA